MFAIVVSFTLSVAVTAMKADVLVLDSSSLRRDANVLRVTGMQGQVLSSATWYYTSENVSFAELSVLPDNAWKRLSFATFQPDTVAEGFWKGSAWFRLQVRVTPNLHNQPLLLVMPSIGAMEWYVNGVFVGGQGRVGNDEKSEQLPSYARSYLRSIPLRGDSAIIYTIAVRYSCYQYSVYKQSFLTWQPAPLLGMDVACVRESEFRQYERRVRSVLVEFGAYIIAPVLACIVHLLLFFLYRRERANLTLALCNGMIAVTALAGLLLLHYVGQPLSVILIVNIISRSAASLAFLAFAYSMYYLFFDVPYPRSRWLIIGLTVFGQIFAFRPLFLSADSASASFQGVLVLPLLYTLYIAFVVVRKKPQGALTLGFGILIVLIATTAETVLELRGIVFAARPVVLGIVIRMGIFLPLPIALMISMGQRIAAQTQAIAKQNEYLENQVQKRTAELQEANEEVHRQIGILKEQSRNIEYANAELQERNTRLDELIQDKAELMSIVAHDLKNPISGIAGMTEMLREEVPPDNSTAQDLLVQMTQTTHRMLDLVKNLLNAAQIESGKMQLRIVECDMKPLLEYTIRHYQAAALAKNITFYTDFTAHETHVYADEQALLQVFDNLISNAVKYSPQEKKVFVRICGHESSAIEHWSNDTTNVPMTNTSMTKNSAMTSDPSPATVLRVEIQDEGPGLNADDKKRLFGKYARLSARPTGGEHSTGLGLNIVKTMVVAMRGKVWCESEANNGATFIVELPMVRR